MAMINYVTEIRFGAGSAAELAQVCQALGFKKPLFITDKGVVAAGLIERILAVNDLPHFHVFDGTPSNPTEAAAREGVASFHEAGCDGIIAVGGGSSIDLAKAVAVSARHPGPLRQFALIEGGLARITAATVPVVAIPTTAGTGSEVTPIAIVTTGETTKSGIVARQLYADMAVLDAELTLGLPSAITAATGIDAMVHAIEAFTSKRLKNPLSDALAIQALQLLAANLVPVCQDGKNVPAREAMLLGAMLAGQAFANAPVAAVHALAYPLGGVFHLPHGLSNALVLPHVLRFNAEAAAPHYAALADALVAGVQGDPHAKTAAFIHHLEALIAATALPMRLRDHGVPEAALPRLARDAMQQTRLLINNPREVTEADALAIYQRAY